MVATGMKTHCCCCRCSCPSVGERQNASRTDELLFPKTGTVSRENRRERGQCFPTRVGRACGKRGHRGQLGEHLWRLGRQTGFPPFPLLLLGPCSSRGGEKRARCVCRAGRERAHRRLGRSRGRKPERLERLACCCRLAKHVNARSPQRHTALLSVQLAPRGFRRKRDATISSARKRGCAAPAAPRSSNAHTERLADREQVLSGDSELAGRPRRPLALRLRISEDPCIAYTLSFMKATCSQHMRLPNIASQLHVAANTSS